MAKLKKDGTPKKSGGRRVSLIPRVADGDRKKSVGLSVKEKLIDSPEKVYKLKMAVYQFIENVYEPNLKIN